MQNKRSNSGWAAASRSRPCYMALQSRLSSFRGWHVTLNFEAEANLQCVLKRRPKFFCNIFYKTRAILVKFGTWFPE